MSAPLLKLEPTTGAIETKKHWIFGQGITWIQILFWSHRLLITVITRTSINTKKSCPLVGYRLSINVLYDIQHENTTLAIYIYAYISVCTSIVLMEQIINLTSNRSIRMHIN